MNTSPVLFDMSKARPITQPSKPLFDMSKAQPVPGAQPSLPSGAAASPDFTANPQGEGTYRMSQSSPGVWGDAPEVRIPFSKVESATGAGYRLHPDDAPVYGHDFRYQGQGPTVWDKTKSMLTAATEPMADAPVYGVGPVRSAVNALSNVGRMPFNVVNRTFRGLAAVPGGTVGAVQNIAQGRPEGFESVNPIAMGEGEYRNLQSDTQNLGPTAAWSNVGGDVVTGYLTGKGAQAAGGLVLRAPDVAGSALNRAGAGMQEAGGGVLNRTAGSLQRDFRWGANPGLAYLEAGGGPAWSMESLARKGAALKQKVGSQIGTAVDEATSQGLQIPASNVSAAINPPIQNARAVISGPGGTGNLAPINAFEASFNPSLYSGAPNLTPRDVFEMKKNVAANTNWSDPTQFGMKNLQQQTTGALGGVLSNAIPELQTLNPQYQGLKNFARRTNLRAQTGSSPLTRIAAKTAYGAGGALLGATHSPLFSALAGGGAIALDSIPVKTTVGSGLYYGGKGLVRMGKGIQGLYAPRP